MWSGLSYGADFSDCPRKELKPRGLDTNQLKLEAVWRLRSAFQPCPVCVCVYPKSRSLPLSPPRHLLSLIFHKCCHWGFVYEKKTRWKKRREEEKGEPVGRESCTSSANAIIQTGERAVKVSLPWRAHVKRGQVMVSVGIVRLIFLPFVWLNSQPQHCIK